MQHFSSATRSTFQPPFTDVFLFPPDYDAWVSSLVKNPSRRLDVPRHFKNISTLRAKAKEIASQTHDYDLLAKQTREFQDLASRCGFSGEIAISNFVASANELIGFGASWRDMATSTHSEITSIIKKEIEASITAAINAAGGSMTAEAKISLTKELTERLSASTDNTIHRLDNDMAARFLALEKRLSDAFQRVLELTSQYAGVADK